MGPDTGELTRSIENRLTIFGALPLPIERAPLKATVCKPFTRHSTTP
jgi:hypothetical protein